MNDDIEKQGLSTNGVEHIDMQSFGESSQKEMEKLSDLARKQAEETVNILVIGAGVHTITRQDMIDAGIVDLIPEGASLVLDCGEGSEFELTGVSGFVDGDEYMRSLPDERRELMIGNGIGVLTSCKLYPPEEIHQAEIPQEQSWQKMNKGKYGKKTEKG